MERIVGKYSWLVLMLLCTYSSAQITLRLTDEDGAQLESVAVGRPFLLQVELKNIGGSLQEPAIENLNRYEHYRSGVQMSTINGNTTATYSYRLRIDSLGVHIIGPASIPNSSEKSVPISILVGENAQYVRPPKKAR